MSYYSSIEAEAVARQFVDAWFEGHSEAHERMARVAEDSIDLAPEVADTYATRIYTYYGSKACKALKVTVDNIYDTIAIKYDFAF